MHNAIYISKKNGTLVLFFTFALATKAIQNDSRSNYINTIADAQLTPENKINFKQNKLR